MPEINGKIPLPFENCLLHETGRDEIIADRILRSELIIYNLETDSVDYLKDTAESQSITQLKKK
jgi:hypothetical protein